MKIVSCKTEPGTRHFKKEYDTPENEMPENLPFFHKPKIAKSGGVFMPNPMNYTKWLNFQTTCPTCPVKQVDRSETEDGRCSQARDRTVFNREW